MKGQLKVKTPAAYLRALGPDRRRHVGKLHKLILEATGLKAAIRGGVIGYGEYHFIYANGKEADWPCVALASNAQHIALHVMCAGVDLLKAKLKGASIGKSCIRLRSTDTLDLNEIRKIVKKAARQNGKTVKSGAAR